MGQRPGLVTALIVTVPLATLRQGFSKLNRISPSRERIFEYLLRVTETIRRLFGRGCPDV